MGKDQQTSQEPRPARLVIADDHELIRIAMRSMLASEQGLEVVGEATNGYEALELCRRLHPDLALIDVRMPVMDGLAASRAIRQECPEISIIIITAYEDPDHLLEALKMGVAGYILKGATWQELLHAIRQAIQGESSLDHQLTLRLLRRLTGESLRLAQPSAEQLTARERQVLQLLMQGQTNREIACTLTVSVGTVKSHIEHILNKLGVADRTQAAVRAVELGLIGPSPTGATLSPPALPHH